MAQLRLDYQEFVERETEVIVVGPEDAKAFSAYWHTHKMPFVGLPDPKASVLRLYGQASQPVQTWAHASSGNRG